MKHQASISDFQDFSTYISCDKKYKFYSNYFKKLRSITLTSEYFIKKSKDYFNKIKENNTNIGNTNINVEDINSDILFNKLNKPNINKIPGCLAMVFTKTNIYKPNNDKLDILNPNNIKRVLPDELTDEASGAINDLLEKFNKSLVQSSDEIEKIFDKITYSFVTKEEADFFNYIREFQEFLNKTKYTETYIQWKDAKNCLNNNCKEMLSYIDDESFLYYDKDKLNFIVPIDLNTGIIRLVKLFEKPTEFEKKKLKELEIKYYKYINTLHSILKKVSEELSAEGIPDKENPFKIAYDKNKINVINTLF